MVSLVSSNVHMKTAEQEEFSVFVSYCMTICEVMYLLISLISYSTIHTHISDHCVYHIHL